MGLPMFTKSLALAFPAIALTIACGIARGQNSATIENPFVLRPLPSAASAPQSSAATSAIYNQNSSAQATPASWATSQADLAASRSASNSTSAPSASPANAVGSGNDSVPSMAPTVTAGEPIDASAAASPAAAASAPMAVPPAAVPTAASDVVPNAVSNTVPNDGSAPRDSRPLSQRLQALRQPAVTTGKGESWDQGTADSSVPPVNTGAGDGASARLSQSSPDDTASHPLAVTQPDVQPNLSPLSADANSAQSANNSLTPPPASSQPAQKPSSRRTVVNPEDLMAAEPSAAPSENVLFKRQSPLLSVETAGPRTVVIGKEALYTVTINNGGDVAAQDLVVGVKIPDWTGCRRRADFRRHDSSSAERRQ